MREDMINGSPIKSMILFAIPMVIGNIFQQIYNIVDSIIVGQFVGEEALAAVGASTSVTMLFISVAIGLGIGCSVVISQLLGAKRIAEMKTAIFTSLIAILAVSLVLTGVGLALNKSILRFMNTPENIINDAMSYLGIYFMGLAFLFMYNVLSSIFNALGLSKIPLWFLLCSSVINIALDLIFVIQFNMGVPGVAWATLIAQAISAVLSFAVLLRKLKSMEHDGSYKIYDWTLLGKMIKIALPSMIQQSIISIGMLLVQTVINGFGSAVIAGFAAAMKIDTIAIVPMITVGNAVSTFAAQNIGAGKTERVKEGLKASLMMIVGMAVVICLLAQVFGRTFIGFFLDPESGSVAFDTGVSYLKTVSIFYIFLGLFATVSGILRGAGDIGVFMASSLINLLFRVLFANLMSTVMGPAAIWWSVPVGWFIGATIAFVRYRQGGWKSKSLIK